MGKGKGGQGRVIVKTPKGMPTQAAMEEMKNFDPMKEMMSAMMSDDAPSDYPPQSPANPDMQIRWPERSTKNTDVSMWIKVYPTYLDSSKTRKLGRRIGTDIAIDKPTLQDITEALTTLSIRHVCEPGKKYGRDPESHWFTPGRVLVELFSPHDQEPVHPEAENKLQVSHTHPHTSTHIHTHPHTFVNIGAGV